MTGPDDKIVRSEIEKTAHEALAASSGVKALGPSPAIFEKIGNEYRYSLLLKSASPKQLGLALSKIKATEKQLPKKVRIIIDVDPVNML